MNKVTEEQLKKYFGYSMYEACVHLKLEINELKHLCREYNIPRWPKKKSKESKNQLFQSFNVPKKNLMHISKPLKVPIAPKKKITISENHQKYKGSETIYWQNEEANVPKINMEISNMQQQQNKSKDLSSKISICNLLN
eukprot:gene62-4311_t